MRSSTDIFIEANRCGAPVLGTGALDLFAEEDMEYARRLIRAGVPTELHVFPGGFHGYDIAPGARVSIAARDASQAALKRFLFG